MVDNSKAQWTSEEIELAAILSKPQNELTPQEDKRAGEIEGMLGAYAVKAFGVVVIASLFMSGGLITGAYCYFKSPDKVAQTVVPTHVDSHERKMPLPAHVITR